MQQAKVQKTLEDFLREAEHNQDVPFSRENAVRLLMTLFNGRDITEGFPYVKAFAELSKRLLGDSPEKAKLKASPYTEPLIALLPFISTTAGDYLAANMGGDDTGEAEAA